MRADRKGLARFFMPASKLILDGLAIRRALTRIAHEINERNADPAAVALVGIQRGGVHVARRLAAELQQIWGRPVPVGILDVTMHRDDLQQQLAPEVHPTEILFDPEDKTLVLVDDVVFHGRTIRAALDALIDFGRPARIQLAALIDRGHRELPIKPDFVGKNLPTELADRVVVKLAEADGEDGVYLEKP